MVEGIDTHMDKHRDWFTTVFIEAFVAAKISTFDIFSDTSSGILLNNLTDISQMTPNTEQSMKYKEEWGVGLISWTLINSFHDPAMISYKENTNISLTETIQSQYISL